MTNDLRVKLTEHRFTMADQHWFAFCSQDRNPIHLVAAVARPLGASGPIVHGVHTVLWCLNALAARTDMVPALTSLSTLSSLRVNFDNFLSVDELFGVYLTGIRPDRLQIELRTGGLLVATLVLGLGAAQVTQPDPAPAPVVAMTDILDIAPETMSKLNGRIACDTASAQWIAAFPDACHQLGARRVAALGGMSALVGMICPGLRSIFNRIALDAADGGADDMLNFRTASCDAASRRVGMSVWGGGWVGTVTAMMRHAPVVQRPIEDLAAYVPRDAFAGVMALIVGGSRGLGEVAGKLVAAGGGLPILTYANDAGKAAAVAQEIEAWGSPCHIMRLDMEADLAPQLAALPAVPDWLLYFATPMIAARRGAPFDAAKLHRFLHFYATAFRDLVHALPCGEHGLRVLYPSSVFVAEPPPGLAEYAMAKAAGEILCRDMVARRQGFRAEILRLPPLATDQNPHLANIDSAVPLLLDGLRALG